MLSGKILLALNEQIKLEFETSNIYLQMSFLDFYKDYHWYYFYE